MPRYRLTIEYCGTGLAGWQRQPHDRSVQQILETAFLRFCGETVRVHGAGRTDAGVHAWRQVAHVDLARERSPETIQGALNYHMRPHRVSVLAVSAVPDTFHARLSATERRYCYRILNRRAPPAIEAEFVWHVPVPLDIEAMAAAARLLEGHHDFTTFRDSACQAKSPMRTLERLALARVGEEVRVTAHARSFLHHQVRNLVGTLSLVGLGRWKPDDVAAALAARDRTRGGPTAPATGLALLEVLYPGEGATDLG